MRIIGMSDYQIKTMTKEEFQTAIEWAVSEGWNPGLHDIDCFYKTDPNGFFAGLLDDNIIAVGSAVRYDQQFAFCGFYIVQEAYRGQGFGLKLTKERLKYVGDRNAGLDGVVGMLSKYERLGYRTAHHNIRFQSHTHFNLPRPKEIKALMDVPFENIQAFDRRHFPAQRDQFLKCWLNQPAGLSLGYFNDKQLRGYGVIRPCIEGFKIGPLFAETESIASELFYQLANHANGENYYLDVPDNNPYALKLIKEHPFEEVFETARMYLKDEPNLEKTNIYGITSFELG